LTRITVPIAIGIKEDLVKYKGKKTSQNLSLFLLHPLMTGLWTKVSSIRTENYN